MVSAQSLSPALERADHDTAAIANRLGVLRESVTASAGKLHTLGLISCNRGRITVLDRPPRGKITPVSAMGW